MKSMKLMVCVLMTAGALAAGCASNPGRRPQILSSRSPAGSLPAPPLNSRQPIGVPSAPVGQPVTQTSAIAVQPQTVVGVPTPGQQYVPLQPGVQAPQNSQQFQPGQANGLQQGAYNGYNGQQSSTDDLSPLEPHPPQN
jgi:hypothetical protein